MPSLSCCLLILALFPWESSAHRHRMDSKSSFVVASNALHLSQGQVNEEPSRSFEVFGRNETEFVDCHSENFDAVAYGNMLVLICRVGTVFGLVALVMQLIIFCGLRWRVRLMMLISLLLGLLCLATPGIASSVAATHTVNNVCMKCGCSEEKRMHMTLGHKALGIVFVLFHGGSAAYFVGIVNIVLCCCMCHLFCYSPPPLPDAKQRLAQGAQAAAGAAQGAAQRKS
ncbi:unnamed protein product [Durusdinium trenchii]|uniref:Uncharacterized protein n=2 Tax=Durusdinium trenchii TaxID=1381693 RepID=A0ABP0LIZ6_9DINO